MTLSIISYCKNSPTGDSEDSPTDTVEFDPTCTNGTASKIKVSTENTENCTVCTTKGYVLTEVGDFEECREIPYVCTNGIASTEKVSVENTENCTACTTVGYVLTKVGNFKECRTPYICTNGKAIDGGAITVTENCTSCDTDTDTDYALTEIGNFKECRTPYICTNGKAIVGGAITTVTENCARCDVGYVRLSVSMDVESFRECPLDTDNDGKPDNTFHDVPADLDDDNDGTPDITDVDADGDGLIEIHTLNDLATIRDDLDGDGVDDDLFDDVLALGNTGCGMLNNPTDCIGYELIQNLDFADGSSYATVHTDWLPDPSLLGNTSVNLNFSSLAEASSEAGWIPIGDSSNTFSATFEGNGFTISNLYVRKEGQVGFFGATSSFAKIRNIGLVGGAVFVRRYSNDYAGCLVGYNNGSITASYATGDATTGDGTNGVGGLVGYNNGGSIIASHATGNVAGINSYVGGLVGYNNGGSIIASHATGNVAGVNSYGGGLVGVNHHGGSIIASYATGKVNGSSSSIGGLVGGNHNGASITASYATGNVNGSSSSIGGLVGRNGNGGIGSYNVGSITASYATGNADGGGLVGINGSINVDSGAYSVMDAKGLTSGIFGTTWGFVWDFGTITQLPALRYADYDGIDNGVDYCKLFPVNIVCGATLLPGPNETRPSP